MHFVFDYELAVKDCQHEKGHVASALRLQQFASSRFTQQRLFVACLVEVLYKLLCVMPSILCQPLGNETVWTQAGQKRRLSKAAKAADLEVADLGASVKTTFMPSCLDR